MSARESRAGIGRKREPILADNQAEQLYAVIVGEPTGAFIEDVRGRRLVAVERYGVAGVNRTIVLLFGEVTE